MLNQKTFMFIFFVQSVLILYMIGPYFGGHYVDGNELGRTPDIFMDATVFKRTMYMVA